MENNWLLLKKTGVNVLITVTLSPFIMLNLIYT